MEESFTIKQERGVSIEKFQKIILHMWKLATVHHIYMPLLIWGNAGVGKSESVWEVARRINKDYERVHGKWPASDQEVNVQVLMIGQLEIADLIGIPRPQSMYPDPFEAKTEKGQSPLYTKPDLILRLKKEYPDRYRSMGAGAIWSDAVEQISETCGHLETTEMAYALPKWFPTEISRPRGILFLDEVNRGKKDVRQSIFQLLLERQMHGHVLPEDWIIVAAANPPLTGEQEGESFVTESFTDKALVNRFIHLGLTPQIDEWMQYATRPKKDPKTEEEKYVTIKHRAGNIQVPVPIVPFEVRRTIAQHPDKIGTLSAPLPKRYYTPRSWTKLGEVATGIPTDIRYAVASGIVGGVAASQWEDAVKENEMPLSGSNILDEYTVSIQVEPILDENGNTRIDPANKKMITERIIVGTPFRERILAIAASGNDGIVNDTCDNLLDEIKSRIIEGKDFEEMHYQNTIQFILDIAVWCADKAYATAQTLLSFNMNKSGEFSTEKGRNVTKNYAKRCTGDYTFHKIITGLNPAKAIKTAKNTP